MFGRIPKEYKWQFMTHFLNSNTIYHSQKFVFVDTCLQNYIGLDNMSAILIILVAILSYFL